MDARAKVGRDVIESDNHETSENGKLLLSFVKRQNLKILNTFKKCSGTITRKRVTVERTEESIIDYLITCDILADVLDEMLIDEEREHVLTKYVQEKV